MSRFAMAIDFVLSNEGGFVDNINDPGAITNYGISLSFISAVEPNWTKERIKNLKKEDAIAIYKKYFWDKMANLENILSPEIAIYLFDMIVNMGSGRATNLLRKVINVLQCIISENAEYIPIFGTLDNKLLTHVNYFTPSQLAIGLTYARIDYYLDLITVNPKLEVFKNGWMKRARRWPTSEISQNQSEDTPLSSVLH